METQIYALFSLALILFNLADGSSILPQTQINVEHNLINTSLATLEFVAVISRHGSRSPLRTYPNDPYPFSNRVIWPNGPQEVTFLGKRQLYRTGEKLRRRYTGFLPKKFYPNEAVVEYNEFNRDFTSATLILAGLYPPVGMEIWNRDLLWDPIPVYLNHFDVCELPREQRCPSYRIESEGLVAKMDREGFNNKSTYDILKKISLGAGVNTTRISELYFVYDALNMQEENGLRIPAWAEEFYPQPMRSICTPVMITTFAGSDKAIKMTAGPELDYIRNILNMKANKTYNSNKKLFIEVSHDCNLVSMLRALGNTDPLLEVRTSAYLTFELHLVSTTYIVKIEYYANSTVDDPQIINVAGCPNPCSLDNFNKFVNRLNPPNWKELCQNRKSDFWAKRN